MSEEAELVNGRTIRHYAAMRIRSEIKRGREVVSRWLSHRSPFRQSHHVHRPESPQSSPKCFKDYLLEVVKTERFALENLPSSVDLGEFGREAERLINFSLQDPKHPEYASMACVDRVGRILLLREAVRGDESGVTFPTTENKRHILNIHSHGGIDTPFSPGDLEPLFIDPCLEKAAVAAEMLVTPSTKMLLLRTKKTPFLPHAPYFPDAVGFAISVEMENHPAMAEEGQILEEQESPSDEQNPQLTKDWPYKLQQLSHKRMFALTQIAQRYHLKLYSCSLEKNIVYPVT